MLDSHCHVDLLTNPVDRARELSRTLSTCVAVTYLPEHFELARRHLKPFPNVVPALGLHPLHARRAQAQASRFRALADSVRFIGEVGLDGSAEGKETFALQRRLFAEIAGAIQAGSFVTVHSRDAWREVDQVLVDSAVGPVCFHYFTAGPAAAEALLARGHYFSVNRRMIEPAGRHAELVRRLPRHRVLVESDAPFLGEYTILQDLETVYRRLAALWQVEVAEAVQQVSANFARCRTGKDGAPQ